MTLSLESPNSYIAGNDGKWDTHTILLAVHSSLIGQILKTLGDYSEAVVILPDFSFSELSVLMQVILGIEKVAFVRGDLLETLCMGHYKNVVFDIIENSPQPSNEIVESDDIFETATENADHNLNAVELEDQLEDVHCTLYRQILDLLETKQRRITLSAVVVTSSSKLRRF